MHVVYWGLKCWVITLWLQMAQDWSFWPALLAAALLAIVPLVSWALAVYGATIAWGWSWWFSAIVFTVLALWAFGKDD